MNPPRCTARKLHQFPRRHPGPGQLYRGRARATRSPFAPAHDSFNRLLNRLEPDPEDTLGRGRAAGREGRGVLVLDDSTLDKPHAKHIGLVTRHWSGKHQKVVRGINLITLLWTDGDRKIPCDYRLFSKADGKTKHDHFWEMLLMAKGRGFSPKYVLFDGWYASLENLKQVRDFGWLWLTRLRGDRMVSADDRRAAAAGRGGGLAPRARCSTCAATGWSRCSGSTPRWRHGILGDQRPGDGRGDAAALRRGELRDRELPPGPEAVLRGGAVPGPRRAAAQRNHIGLAVRAFLRLEWHFFTTGSVCSRPSWGWSARRSGATWPDRSSRWPNRQLRNSYSCP